MIREKASVWDPQMEPSEFRAIKTWGHGYDNLNKDSKDRLG